MPCIPQSVRLLQQCERGLDRVIARRPVQKQDIDDVELKVAETLFHRWQEMLRIHVFGVDLGGDKQFVARHRTG
jgi:hypothetical protein